MDSRHTYLMGCQFKKMTVKEEFRKMLQLTALCARGTRGNPKLPLNLPTEIKPDFSG